MLVGTLFPLKDFIRGEMCRQAGRLAAVDAVVVRMSMMVGLMSV